MYELRDTSGIIDECRRFRKLIKPLNQKFNGPLADSSHQNTAIPFVFLLGNHSSGKSSFVNYILGRNIQTTGGN